MREKIVAILQDLKMDVHYGRDEISEHYADRILVLFPTADIREVAEAWLKEHSKDNPYSPIPNLRACTCPTCQKARKILKGMG